MRRAACTSSRRLAPPLLQFTNDDPTAAKAAVYVGVETPSNTVVNLGLVGAGLIEPSALNEFTWDGTTLGDGVDSYWARWCSAAATPSRACWSWYLPGATFTPVYGEYGEAPEPTPLAGNPISVLDAGFDLYPPYVNAGSYLLLTSVTDIWGNPSSETDAVSLTEALGPCAESRVGAGEPRRARSRSSPAPPEARHVLPCFRRRPPRRLPRIRHVVGRTSSGTAVPPMGKHELSLLASIERDLKRTQPPDVHALLAEYRCGADRATLVSRVQRELPKDLQLRVTTLRWIDEVRPDPSRPSQVSAVPGQGTGASWVRPLDRR